MGGEFIIGENSLQCVGQHLERLKSGSLSFCPASPVENIFRIDNDTEVHTADCKAQNRAPSKCEQKDL